jgi:hypothetical protein
VSGEAGVLPAAQWCEGGVVTSRTYSIVVEGELSDSAAVAFEGMRLTREDGNTVLSGTVRDQAELLALLLRASDLGLTLLCARDEAYELASAGLRSPR